MQKMSQPKVVRKGKETPCPCLGKTGCTSCFGLGRVVEWHNEPDQMARLMEYCKQDVIVGRELHKRLLPLSPSEKKIWLLDFQINSVGVKIDRRAAEKAVDLVNAEEMRLHREMRAITQQQVATCKAHLQLKQWIIGQGVPAQGVAKNDVTELLARADLPDRVRAALETRREAAKSSTAKLKAMLSRAGANQRIRGLFQFHGANTGRWSGRSVQLQNLPKPTILKDQAEVESVFEALAKRSLFDAREYIDLFLGSPMSVVSDCLRGFLVPETGRDFVAADFSAIEARVTAWLAGQEDVLELFRKGEDVYIDAAQKTYRVVILKKDPRRQHGKVQVLAFGFEGGVGAMQAMCKTYGIQLAPAFPGLWAIASSERKSRVIKSWEAELTRLAKKKTVSLISKEEWMASELLKLAWRESNPKIVAFWKLIEQAAIYAVEKPGVARRVHNDDGVLPEITFIVKGSFLFCRLPSGRRLTYPYPQVETKETPWGQPKKMLTYKFEHPTTRKWIRGSTYGGSLTENVVQAVSADVLREAMVRCEDHGYPVVMHVHDEVVSEVDENFGSLSEFESIVSELPSWASGLPIAAEGWRGFRYRK